MGELKVDTKNTNGEQADSGQVEALSYDFGSVRLPSALDMATSRFSADNEGKAANMKSTVQRTLGRLLGRD